VNSVCFNLFLSSDGVSSIRLLLTPSASVTEIRPFVRYPGLDQMLNSFPVDFYELSLSIECGSQIIGNRPVCIICIDEAAGLQGLLACSNLDD
jgi:hypothetical protein